MKHTIAVTQDDIDATDNFQSITDCAMAKALKREFGDDFDMIAIRWFRLASGKVISLPLEAILWNKRVCPLWHGPDAARAAAKPFVFEVDTNQEHPL